MIAVASRVLIFLHRVKVIAIIVIICIRVSNSIEFDKGILNLSLGLSRKGLPIRKRPVRIIYIACRLHYIRGLGDIRGFIKGFGNDC